jgi:hypothetical protein
LPIKIPSGHLEKTAQRGATLFVPITKYNSGDHIKKYEMGGVCGTYGESEYRVLLGNLQERDHVEDLGGDVKITKKKT